MNNNWETIKTLLLSTNRGGVERLIDFLDRSDFKTAPASTKFHLSVKGGLMQHSLNVLFYARQVNANLDNGLAEDTLILAALLHDLCKVNYYIEAEILDKEWKDKTDQWRKIKGWKVKDQFPLGHGEKSVIVASQFINLRMIETEAIRWHMGFSDPGVHFNYPSGSPFRQALETNPLVKVIMIADQMAELVEVSGRGING